MNHTYKDNIKYTLGMDILYHVAYMSHTIYKKRKEAGIRSEGKKRAIRPVLDSSSLHHTLNI